MCMELSIKSYSRLISTNVTIDIERAPDATLWFIILQKITNVKKSLHSDKKNISFFIMSNRPKMCENNSTWCWGLFDLNAN